MDITLWSHHPKREQLGPRDTQDPVPESRGQLPIGADRIVALPWNDAGLVQGAFHEHRGRMERSTAIAAGSCRAKATCSVTPDVATFGKAVSAGLPLSVAAGKREIMEQMFNGVAC